MFTHLIFDSIKKYSTPTFSDIITTNMHCKILAVILLTPLALAAPTPVPSNDNIVGHQRRTIRERDTSSVIGSLITAALPLAEKALGSLMPVLEKMILGKRSDGSLVYEIEIPHKVPKAGKE